MIFILRVLVALVVGAIVYAVLKPIIEHFGIDIIWDYIVAVIAAGFAFYFDIPGAIHHP